MAGIFTVYTRHWFPPYAFFASLKRESTGFDLMLVLKPIKINISVYQIGVHYGSQESSMVRLLLNDLTVLTVFSCCVTMKCSR